VVTAASEAVLSYDSQVIPYHIKIPAMDYEGFLLDPYFDQVTDFIETHLRVTNVLVHCMAGISRSVSFVIAYLMKFRGMKYDEALGFIRSRRSVVVSILIQANPNSGFVTQLKRYRKYLKSHGKISKN
jgi:protein-tyrosine phosphatase